nr:dammarenediol 12-hydroxylase-like [Coffea arabica]
MMGLSYSLLFLLFLVPFAYLCFPKLWLRKKLAIANSNSSCQNQRLPPGRTGWPLLGESLEYFTKIRQGVPYQFVKDRMNKYLSKVFRTSLIGQPMVILCSAEGNKFLFSNERKLVQVWWPSTMDKIFPKSDHRPSSEHSNRLRKLLPFILKTDVLREYVGIMDAVMKKHLQTEWNCEEVNVGEKAKKYLLTLACNIFLGLDDPEKIDELAKGTEDVGTGIHSMPFNLQGTALNRAIKASKLMRKEVEALIRQRRSDVSEYGPSSAKDFVSHMVLARDDNGQLLSDGDIASHLVGLVQAGYTTIHSTITIIMKYLSELPDIYTSVLKEQKEIAIIKEQNGRLSWEDLRKMKHTWDVALEVLRIYTPGTGSFREAITDFVFDGYTIPRGSKIHWIFDVTHKNPEYFHDPEKFDPSRFQGDGMAPFTFVPFGGGARMCPGNEYARVSILIFLHNAVTHFRWKKLIPDEEVLHYPVPRPAQGLPIRLYPHQP